MSNATEHDLTLTLSVHEQNLLLDALVNSKLDTQHYLGAQPIGEPKDTDTCCAAHRRVYEDRKSTEATLLCRQQSQQSLVDRIEAAQQTAQSSQQIDPRFVALVYKDESGQMHSQPVSDVITQGTLVDPESGNDLAIISVQLVDMAQ